MRKVCAEPIRFNADGTIDEVMMTTQGIGGPIDPKLRMDAARACELKGHLMIKVRRPAHDIPVEYLSEIRNNDVTHWRYFDFGRKGVCQFTCKTTGPCQAGHIELHIDTPEGPIIGTCRIQPQSGEVAYAFHSTAVTEVSGVHALVMVFKGDQPENKDQNLMNLEWFQFK